MSSNAFRRDTKAAQSAGQTDHEKPRYLARIREKDAVVTLWVNCPICLARPNGFASSGRPKYSGGTVPVSDPSLSSSTSASGAPRINAIAPCTCFVGQRRKDSAERRWGALGCYQEWASYDRFPPERRWPRGEDADVEIADMGGR